MISRDQHVDRSGFAVDPRILSLIVATRSEVDPVLKLDQPTPVQRARAVANLLWPWGASTQSSNSFNPYASVLSASLDVVRENWHPPVKIIDVDVWDAERRDEVHAELVRAREVVLRTAQVNRRSLRGAIVDLATLPVEVGPLMFHPQVTGVSDRAAHVEARVLLREAWL